MGLATRLLEHPTVYRLFQSGFAEAKLRPVLRRTDLSSVRRVLDVACGPGTNTAHFAGTGYLGIDVNPRYVEWARRTHRREFRTVDVTAPLPRLPGPFDLILVNSFFHHVSDDDSRRILRRLAGLLTSDGRLHVLDLVWPETRGVARLLARLDRGQFARPLPAWRALLGEVIELDIVEPYPLTLLGVTLWHMVYLRGPAR